VALVGRWLRQLDHARLTPLRDLWEVVLRVTKVTVFGSIILLSAVFIHIM
jgi:hypothetical protein